MTAEEKVDAVCPECGVAFLRARLDQRYHDTRCGNRARARAHRAVAAGLPPPPDRFLGYVVYDEVAPAPTPAQLAALAALPILADAPIPGPRALSDALRARRVAAWTARDAVAEPRPPAPVAPDGLPPRCRTCRAWLEADGTCAACVDAAPAGGREEIA